jgi:KipI family sensor histidine kinase inhibitor
MVPFGDSALFLSLGDSLDPILNTRVHQLAFYLRGSSPSGVIEWVPGYVSLLVYYDPKMTCFEEVRVWIEKGLAACQEERVQPCKRVEVFVVYGGEAGPDLAFVARHHGITPAEVVRIHTAAVYKVGMMGFTPGFAYLMGLNPSIRTPRLATPRTDVPAGSVGIADTQTGIYPLDSPGGWQLIGRTEQHLFDPSQQQPFLLSPGDEVCFIPLPEGVKP